MESKAKIADLLLEKFVSEEIMTKSEFQISIDRIMEKHEVRIDAKFQNMGAHFDKQFLKIDARYNWIIGLILTSTIGIAGMGLKIMSMIPH